MPPFTAFFLLPIQILAAPLELALQPRGIQSIGSIDPSTDEWSSTLSGIGPLILLVGERSTKQVLRNVRGISNAFSLAAAPLGLLSVTTSLIRLCGTQILRAFIGYELEARTVVGIEVTRVNCGGVSAHLTHGYVVRSIVANPASRLVAVSILDGTEKEEGLEDQALARIRASERFEREKSRLGISKGEANVDWCLHITAPDLTEEVMDAIVQTLIKAVRLELSSKEVVEFQRSSMAGIFDGEKPRVHSAGPEISRLATNGSIPSSSSSIRKLRSAPTSNTLIPEDSRLSVLAEAPTLSTTAEKRSSGSPFWDFTFMTTFDAVSEFTSGPIPKFSSAAIGITSFLGIITVHLLALWQNDWIMSIGWILVMVGYLGIVFSVMVAALLIHSSCICIKLDTPTQRNSFAQWRDGMVVSVKNVDSMDTTGSAFVSSPSSHQNLEAVYIKPSTRYDRFLTSFIATSLVFAFIAHYLGLRAIKWWASIGELGICILAASARSLSNGLQPHFSEVNDVKIDKRCSSTGVIRTQTAHLIDKCTLPTYAIDARSYSLRSLDNPPTVGERVAYQTAKLAQHDPSICELLKTLTGMNLVILPCPSPQSPSTRSALVYFTGGILVSEGLASPASRMLLSFQSKISDLAAPSSLLGRAIMRQPEWRLQEGVGKGIPLGNVYVFAMQSMLDWWTVSEDRNDMSDLQRNLHWPMFLVNVAFFLRCLIIGKEDEELLEELDIAHKEVGNGDVNVAQDVIKFLRSSAWAVI